MIAESGRTGARAEWAALNQVADLSGGYPFRSAVRTQAGGTIAVVQLQEASRLADELGESVPWVTNEEGKLNRFFLRRDDVLIQARGFRHPAAMVMLEVPAISAPGLHMLRPRAGRITSGYLAWCLNHPKIQTAIAALAQGSHAPFIAVRTLGTVPIPVPPIAVQRRIAEVDELRRHERELAAQLAAAQDDLVNAATWEAAIS